MAQNYWLRNRRLSRRAALRGAGAATAGLAGAALIGCGEDEEAPVDDGGATGTPSGPSGAATPTSAEPQSGGTLRLSTTIDPDTLDVLSASSYKTSYPTGFVYSRLVMYDHGDGGPAPGSVTGDLAEKWEQADDTTFVFTLRGGVTWDQREPTSGRALSAEDVVQSWEKFKETSAYRSDLDNAASPDAPVQSVEAVDDSTVQFKLAFPDALFLPILAWPFNFWVHPQESMNGGFDPASEMRGTGPWILEDFSPSVGRKYVRNPDWYGGPERPYLERVEELLIPDAAQAEAQFKSGNVLFGGVSTENLALVVNEVADAHLVAASPASAGPAISFSYREGQPFTDERVRQALSMSIDRDAFIDIFNDPESLESAGVSVNRYWNTPLSAGYGDFWLDPKGSDFGDAAQYLQHNVEEARRLLDAAGFNDSNPLTSEFIFTPQYGRDWPTRAETFQAMAAEAGIRLNIRASDYTTDWIPNYLRAHGDYAASDGGTAMAMHPHGARSDPGQWLNVFFQSTGANNVVGEQYPELDELIRQQRAEFDFEARVGKIHDIQRYMVENMVAVPAGMGIDSVSIAYKKLHGPERYQTWPGGFVTYQMGTEILPYYWIES